MKKNMKVFVFTKTSVKRIPFQKLRVGNVFYMETPAGELEVEFYYGMLVFLWEVTEKPFKNERGVYTVSCQPAEAK